MAMSHIIIRQFTLSQMSSMTSFPIYNQTVR